MVLDSEEVALFYKLNFSLMSFVNERERVLPGEGGGIADFESQRTEEKFKVHQALYADQTGLIDAYLAENPDDFEEEELAEIASWKAAVTGKFFAFRQLKRHMVMIPGTEPPTVYGVVGLTGPISRLTPPVLMETTLLPFQGKIIYDGLTRLHNVSFGPGLKSSLNEVYREAKAGPGVITSMADSRSPRLKKKKPSAKEKITALAARLKKKLASNREKKHEIARFHGEVLPKFNAWVDENLKDEKAQVKQLMAELQTLAVALDRMKSEWRAGRGRTRAQLADAILADVKAELDEMEEKEEDFAEGEDRREEDAGDAPDDGFPDDDFSDGMPDLGEDDFMLNFLFEEFLRERGINPWTMAKEDYDKVREKFMESVEHAKSGNRAAFEKGMSRLGADESAENMEAVKKAFRRLARKLHPDSNKDYGDEAKELWEELLVAKKSLDLATIERLDLHWRIVQEDEISPADEISMKKLSEYVDDDARELKFTETELRDHPIWPYRNEEISDEIATETRERMKNDIGLLLEEKRELEGEIARFRAAPGRKKAVRKMAKKKTKKKPKKKAATKSAQEKAPDRSQGDFDFF